MARTIFASVILTGVALASSSPSLAGFGDTDQQRTERWNELQRQIFGDKKAMTDDQAVKLDAPQRAEDAPWYQSPSSWPTRKT